MGFPFRCGTDARRPLHDTLTEWRRATSRPSCAQARDPPDPFDMLRTSSTHRRTGHLNPWRRHRAPRRSVPMLDQRLHTSTANVTSNANRPCVRRRQCDHPRERPAVRIDRRDHHSPALPVPMCDREVGRWFTPDRPDIVARRPRDRCGRPQIFLWATTNLPLASERAPR
jgi:hypothetical protein